MVTNEAAGDMVEAGRKLRVSASLESGTCCVLSRIQE